MATNHAYTSAQGQSVIPTFAAACPHASAHSIWAGIGGGFSSATGLIQAGITTTQAGVNTVAVFYEIFPLQAAIKPGVPGVSIGDLVSVVVTYYQSGAYFTIKNLTTGIHRQYHESGVSSYYDSSTTEWIDERPSGFNLAHPVDYDPSTGIGYYYYRKATKTHWSGMKANGQVAGHWTDGKVTLRRPAPIDTVLGTATLTTSASDTHTWKHCS